MGIATYAWTKRGGALGELHEGEKYVHGEGQYEDDAAWAGGRLHGKASHVR